MPPTAVFRIEVTGRCSLVILMQLASQSFKQSEEAVSGATHQIAELPFLNILSYLSKAGVSLLASITTISSGLLYLEDLETLP